MPRTVDHSGEHVDNDHYNLPKKRDSDLLLTLDLGQVTLKMPESRMSRSIFSSSPPKKTWPRLIAKTYNENAVGSFAGNFDKPMNLNLRAGNTILNFREFTEFSHDPVDACHYYEVDMESYFKQDNVSKLKSLVISDKVETLEISGPASIKGESRTDLDKIIYTCTEHKCVVPCVCYLCNDENPDECEHKIRHPGFFNPKEHLFTVRNADSYDINLNEDDLEDGNRYCTNRKCRGCVVPHRQPRRSFSYRLSCLQVGSMLCLCTDCPYCKSLDVLKYPGTLQSCESCKMKLLQHESYHFIYHYMCLFCLESLNRFKHILTNEDYWEAFDERRFQEKVSCHFCSRLFFDKQKRQRHIEIVHKKNPDFLFVCKECSRAFGSKQALNYHINSFHEEINLGLICGICEKSFKMDQNLDQHMREVHSDITFDCELCMSKFSRQSNLNHHYKVVHDTAINSLYANDDPTIFDYFECDICDYTSREKRTLVHHEKYVHRKDGLEELFCDSCPFTTFEKKTLNRHQKVLHAASQAIFSCNLCNFKTKWKSNLRQHNKNKHDTKQEIFQCDKCDYESNRLHNIKRHVKMVHGGRFKCKECDFKGRSKKALSNHMKVEHGIDGDESVAVTIFNCDKCKYRTIDENLYLVHSNSKHLECEKCEFVTSCKELMNLHKTTNHKRNRRKRKLLPDEFEN